MIWIVIGKMFVNQSFTKDKAVINGKTVQTYRWISQLRFTFQKIYPLQDTAFGADCLPPFRILKIITVGLKNGFWQFYREFLQVVKIFRFRYVVLLK